MLPLWWPQPSHSGPQDRPTPCSLTALKPGSEMTQGTGQGEAGTGSTGHGTVRALLKTEFRIFVNISVGLRVSAPGLLLISTLWEESQFIKSVQRLFCSHVFLLSLFWILGSFLFFFF